MYFQGCPIDADLIFWAEQEIEMLTTNFLNVALFIQYLKEHWLQKVKMWCVGNCNIPHAGQDTNVVMESFHSNLKQILYS